jgi:hypothetical protein
MFIVMFICNLFVITLIHTLQQVLIGTGRSPTVTLVNSYEFLLLLFVSYHNNWTELGPLSLLIFNFVFPLFCPQKRATYI